LDENKLKTNLSVPFDDLRSILLTKTQAATTDVGPLALFRNQTYTIPLLQKIMIECYGLSADPVVAIKIANQLIGQPYPIDLFSYLALKSPQIGNLT
jgi:hypothetical protein